YEARKTRGRNKVFSQIDGNATVWRLSVFGVDRRRRNHCTEDYQDGRKEFKTDARETKTVTLGNDLKSQDIHPYFAQLYIV
ncbi:MAG: hypothetical protein KTR19_09260, partial [Hyphomicrobiales bacterium]|nr:hypothetical protein [Hyphomicrobiales bacterium]